MRRHPTIFCFLCSLIFVALAVWADSAANLRPVADGGTEQWQNNANTSCTSANCYTEVNEASGANCSTTPGDGTFNHSTTTQNSVQTYDLDIASIPDGATLQTAVVSGCLQRGGSQNAAGRFKARIDGSVTNCSTTFTTTSTWSDFSCTIDFPDFVKSSSTDFEVGWENTQVRDVRGTAIKAEITYSPASGRHKRVYDARRLLVRSIAGARRREPGCFLGLSFESSQCGGARSAGPLRSRMNGKQKIR